MALFCLFTTVFAKLLLFVTLWAGGAAECSSPCHGEGRGFKSRPARHCRQFADKLIIFNQWSLSLLPAVAEGSPIKMLEKIV